MDIEYAVIEAMNVKDLAEEVNKKIADGWTPIGGVSVSLSESDNYQYYATAQALTRNKT